MYACGIDTPPERKIVFDLQQHEISLSHTVPHPNPLAPRSPAVNISDGVEIRTLLPARINPLLSRLRTTNVNS